MEKKHKIMNKHLKNKLFNLNNVERIEYKRKTKIDNDKIYLYADNILLDNNHLYPHIIFYFVSGDTHLKIFKNEDEAQIFMEMLESRYNLIDLSKDFI